MPQLILKIQGMFFEGLGQLFQLQAVSGHILFSPKWSEIDQITLSTVQQPADASLNFENSGNVLGVSVATSPAMCSVWAHFYLL